MDSLIRGLRTDPPFPPPAWIVPPFPKPPGDKAHPPDAAAKKAFEQTIEDHKQELRAWYINGLVSASSPLTEKMVLFWHNHSTSSLEKTFLGKTGNFNGDDVIDIILQQDRPAIFPTEKMWRYFVSPQPDPALVQAWAAAFRSSGYQITTLLRLLLGSDAFWAAENRNELIKSPVELLIGFIRTWGIADYDPKRLTYQLSRLGQDLFNPLSVKGWPVGQDWIDAATLLERRRDIADLVNSFRKQSQMAAANLE